MQRSLTFTLSAVLAFSPAVPASAQPEAPRSVKSSVEAVAADVEVLVLDSKGKPVEGLAKGDFRLFVNGKETPIDWLEAPAAPAPAAPGSSAAPAAPAAEVLTGAIAARRMHSTVFVISDLQSDLRSRNAGLDALKTYVDRMPAAEEAAVYLLDNGVRRLQAFTSDRSALKKALDKPARTLPRAYVFPQRGSVEWEGQSRQMLRNFSTVLDTIANRPEPKTVVVMAGPISPTGFVQPIGGPAGSGALGQTVLPGSPTDGIDVLSTSGDSYTARGLWNFLAEAKEAESQALLARATVVAVDPAGLYSPDGRAEIGSMSSPSGRPPRDAAAALRPANNVTEGDAVDSFLYRSDTFALIAQSTGGARLGFTNKPVESLTAEAKLLAQRYRLGFTPPDGTSARRDIRVKATRPGVVVRAAAGQRSLTPETAARARFAALLLSADAPKGDFAIALETKAATKDRKDDAFPFDVVVPVGGVYAEERGDTKRARLELLIAGVDEEGRASEPMVMPFSVTVDKAAGAGAFFRKDSNFTLDRRWKGRLFVGVRDTSTNRLGAVALPIGI
ncbi:MAG TPA: VWA domain-containing protein [Thermoanaerobaculia bacterium]|jgi:VWFA-related protein